MFYAGEALITGSGVADALLEYARQVVQRGVSVVVDIPVLESNGTTAMHRLLLGPSSQLDITDIEGHAMEPEEDFFPMPIFPPLGSVALPSAPKDYDTRSLENELFEGHS